MEVPDFPSNSKLPPKKKEAQPQKNLKPIADGKVKKKTLGRKFTETFVGGDLKTTVHYMLFDVAVPGLKDMIADATTQGIERMIFGQARGPRRSMGPLMRPGPQPGRVDYRGVRAQGQPTHTQMAVQPTLPQRQRPMVPQEVGDFQEILLESRVLADVALERMGDVISQFGSVSVADLYSLVNLKSTHTDNNWGWTDLVGSSVSRDRQSGLYLLNLPDPSAF
jgi:hypothetical protein